jgi:hypothetical protein
VGGDPERTWPSPAGPRNWAQSAEAVSNGNSIRKAAAAGVAAGKA